VRFTARPHLRPPAYRLMGGSLILGAAITVAACGSSAATGSGSGSSPSAGSSSASSAGTSSSTATVSATNVPGVGTVLVNGQGRTLYMLTSEKGGKVTCTSGNGCTKLWPETIVPNGATAAKGGSGVMSSLLGTVKEDNGSLEVTYNGWPLYTFAGDSGPGVAHGQGITSFGGTWYVLNSAGDPVTAKSQPSASSSPAGSGGYGY
jgi:predicted lipoprotein with Yx(FWY)xxD motif